MFKVLIVCTGNTCRSPLAHALLLGRGGQAPPGRIVVESRGLAVFPGAPASAGSRAAAAAMGLCLDGHSARQLTTAEIREADLILVMTAAHRRAVAALCADAAKKTFTLGEFAGGGDDVPDPFGGGDGEYRECARRLAELAAPVWEKIVSMAGKAGRTEKNHE